MSEIRWEDPPPPRPANRGARWVDIVEELRAHPGRWARIDHLTSDSARNTASKISRGNFGPLAPPGAWEAVSRTTDGVSVLYVRYVGGD